MASLLLVQTLFSEADFRSPLCCIGARGVSLTFSSGDGGVGDGDSDPATTECISNDGQNRTEFLPLFPPSCPL